MIHSVHYWLAAYFDFPKPVYLIEKVLMLGTNEEDIILDFFCGSGTTAQAALELNRKDNGNRQFIMVQAPVTTGVREFPSIAEITKERIRRVIGRMQKEDRGKLDLSSRNKSEDLGFRVFKLARSSYKAWQEYTGDSVAEIETLFDRIETPLVDGWTPENLLTEVLLLQGFPLDSTITLQSAFKNNTVQQVVSDACAHQLFICLDAAITDTTIAQLQLRPEDVFVCLDSALTDQAKMRLADRCNLSVI